MENVHYCPPQMCIAEDSGEPLDFTLDDMLELA